MCKVDNQKANVYFNSGFNENYTLSNLHDSFKSNFFYFGEIKEVLWKEKKYKVRIIGNEGKKCKVHFFGWEDKWDCEYDYGTLEDIKQQTVYKQGSEVKVLSKEVWYDCSVVKHDGHFHHITYKRYDAKYDEWVTNERMKIE